ncbi:uncharacterized protein EI90DRAFT_3071192 [Cantharellus anzutake]|uniref:uncharacterized protein n=1 Tax=Cantharellus anzutake TaxID=1750568 RepID=UPI0019071881|nr:uncharacterized protein EI90DRAFT_3071192 [Cantharellus anzutake]KAF8326023.1 hypothetical protein EI90DRAFT_3071192 [Cantharellus anzutake]
MSTATPRLHEPNKDCPPRVGISSTVSEDSASASTTAHARTSSSKSNTGCMRPPMEMPFIASEFGQPSQKHPSTEQRSDPGTRRELLPHRIDVAVAEAGLQKTRQALAEIDVTLPKMDPKVTKISSFNECSDSELQTVKKTSSHTSIRMGVVTRFMEDACIQTEPEPVEENPTDVAMLIEELCQVKQKIEALTAQFPTASKSLIATDARLDSLGKRKRQNSDDGEMIV